MKLIIKKVNFFFLDNKKNYNTSTTEINLNTQLNLVRCLFILKMVGRLDLPLAKEVINENLLLI